MTKLMRAEWYRFRHSAGYFKAFIIFCILIFISVFPNYDWANSSVTDNLPYVTDATQGGLAMFLCTVICAALGAMFTNRTAYYEIMDGNSTHSIILSKVFVYTGSALVFFVVPNFIMLAVVSVKNGIGIVDNLPLFALLYVIIVIHLVSSAVLHTFLFKNMIAAAFPYIRFICFEVMGASLIPMMAQQLFDVSDSTCQKIVDFFSWLPCNQLAVLTTGVDSTLAVKVIVSFVVESVIIYLLAYRSLKRKKFKK